jgi:predicted dehydrogenase
MELAIIGSYGHVRTVLNGAAKLDDVQLVAAARWGEDDPLGFVDQHAAAAGVEVYDDYRLMLHEVRPEIVGVFMPLYRNAEASIAAVGFGAHVISEKPLATTLADLSALGEAVAVAGVKINALLEMRGHPPYVAIHDAVAAGRIGEPMLAYGQKSYPFGRRDDYYKSRETYGGSILWAAIHALDFVSYCTGKGYARVAATQSNVAHPTHAGMEDCGGILLDLAGGGHAMISFDYLRPFSEGVQRRWGDERLRIVGTEGLIQLSDDCRRVELTTPTAVEELPLPPERDIFAEFVASVRGEGDGLITTEESIRITEVAIKARDAADTGRAVAL